MFYNTSEYLNDKKIIAKQCLSIIDLIAPVFAEFDGKRCKLANGDNSAPYQKLITAFRKAAEEITPYKNTGNNIWISTNDFSAYINVKICVLNKEGSGCRYHEKSIYFGRVKNEVFNFDLTANDKAYFENDVKIETSNYESYKKEWNTTLKISFKSIESKQKKIKALNDKIEALNQSLPYELRELLK